MVIPVRVPKTVRPPLGLVGASHKPGPQSHSLGVCYVGTWEQMTGHRKLLGPFLSQASTGQPGRAARVTVTVSTYMGQGTAWSLDQGSLSQGALTLRLVSPTESATTTR